MASNARLYTVQGPRGAIYALHDLGTGMIWTEPTEHAARSVAREKQMTITEEETISRPELLRLMGYEPEEQPLNPTPTPASKPAPPPQRPGTPAQGNPLGGSRIVAGGSSVRIHQAPVKITEATLEEKDEAIVIARAESAVRNPFCTKPSAAASQTDETEGKPSETPPPSRTVFLP